ncbi:hypothetical protein [Agrobacterium pusense]|uniref:hypothetical protein n=1 Tax=Agrobacterium pusense TaxID=648995 RepID=UPI000D1AE31E|nr:hypothetical protein [Agrobacterium pusense]
MQVLWFFAGYLLFNVFVWVLLFDEYDTLVRGWQQTNFSFHERLRLAALLPGLPLVLLLALAINARQWRTSGSMIRNFAECAKDHVAIILTGSKADYVKPAA